jgi:endonuclease III-like uncharacterized protein
MTIREFFETKRRDFGDRADPDRWWEIFCGRTNPPTFERAISNILVQNTSWNPVRSAVEALDRLGLLEAAALATAPLESISDCVKATGLQQQKASRLKALGGFVMTSFGNERLFCERVSRGDLLQLPGFGEETADRALLYACSRLAWPVDTYCLRVLASIQVIQAVPIKPAEKRSVVRAIKQMVAEEIPHNLDDWQRLHAMMQLTGVELRTQGK